MMTEHPIHQAGTIIDEFHQKHRYSIGYDKVRIIVKKEEFKKYIEERGDSFSDSEGESHYVFGLFSAIKVFYE